MTKSAIQTTSSLGCWAIEVMRMNSRLENENSLPLDMKVSCQIRSVASTRSLDAYYLFGTSLLLQAFPTKAMSCLGRMVSFDLPFKSNLGALASDDPMLDRIIYVRE